MTKPSLILTALLLLIAAGPCPGLAREYFFSNAGNDATGDGSKENPWATLDKANSLDLEPGDALRFRGGDTFTTTPENARNILENSGFESGDLLHWGETFDGTAGNSKVVTGGGAAFAGRSALRISGIDHGGQAQNITAKVGPGHSYRLTYFARVTDEDPTWTSAGISFKQDGADGTNIRSDSAVVTDTEYSRLQVFITAPPEFDFAHVWTYKFGGDHTAFFDEFELIELSPLILSGEDAGTAENPVTVSSYGEGRATIDGGSGSAVVIQTSGIEISNLHLRGNFTNDEQEANWGHGLLITGSTASSSPLNHVHITDLQVNGFREAGILIDGAFADVRIERCTVFDIGEEGIAGHAHVGRITDPVFPIQNVYVGHCRVYDIWGRKSDTHSHTGNGIFFSGVDGLLVEHNRVNNCGVNSVTTSGPVGVFAWRTRNTVFQFNEIYEIQRKQGQDGGAIDFGELVTDSVIQYNYTHNNDGYSILVDLNYGAGATGRNVIVRYNISENDARERAYGAIFINGVFEGLRVHNNTVYMTPGTVGVTSGIDLGFHMPAPTDVKVYNNIFLFDDSANPGKILAVNIRKVGEGVHFANNIYHNLSGNGLKFHWGDTTYDDLAGWREATGQEMLEGRPVGSTLDPRLSAPGRVGTLDPETALHQIDSYRLQAGSPAIDAGLDLQELFGLEPGPRDYFGNSVPSGAALDIGAHEFPQ